MKIKRKFELKFKNKKICIVIDSMNDIRLLRFHIYRKNDGLIISNINEIKENAILLLL